MTSIPVNTVNNAYNDLKTSLSENSIKDSDQSFKEFFSKQLSDNSADAAIENSSISKESFALADAKNSFPDKTLDNHDNVDKDDLNSFETASKKSKTDQTQDSSKITDKESNSGADKTSAKDNKNDVNNKKTVEKTEETVDTEKNIEEDGQISDEAMEVIATAVADLIKDVSEITGISEEDLTLTMESMDLKPEDLLVNENLNEVILTAKGIGDKTEILTDEALYTSLGEASEKLNDTVEDLASQLSVDADSLTKAIANNDSAQNTDLNPEEAISLEDAKNELTTVNEEEPLDVGDVENESAINDSIQVMEDSNNTDSANLGEDSKAEDENNSQGETKTEAKQKTANESKTQFSSENQNVINKDFEDVYTSINETFTEETSYIDDDARNIMNQILDNLKAQISVTDDSVEMQLHPASLGTVSVSLASKNGNVTAVFSTQNETVKQALEGQLIALKENFEERGVKVDAIEVTVKSHEFEQNMGQTLNQNNGDNTQTPGNRRNRRIRLNISDIENLENLDGLDGEEMRAAQIMQTKGNTVDYTA